MSRWLKASDFKRHRRHRSARSAIQDAALGMDSSSFDSVVTSKGRLDVQAQWD
jgi:hypothetical protein